MLLAILVPILALNVIAFFHARAMTHFTAAGQRTAKSENLPLGSKVRVLLTGVTMPRPVNRRSPQDYNLIFRTHRIPVGGVEFLEAWFAPAPAARGIVLLFPPYASSKEALLPSAVLFHELGFDTLLVDFVVSVGPAAVIRRSAYERPPMSRWLLPMPGTGGRIVRSCFMARRWERRR